MEYRAALRRLLLLVDHERMTTSTRARVWYDLGRMEALLLRLENPHLGRPTVHIAGTKGKGSTAAMCASVLSQEGYRTGLYTSPHLHTFRERISLDGVPVSEVRFASLADEIWPELEWVGNHAGRGEVTMFEALTAMAFCYFRKEADVQVLEVGLGGRLDTTNLVSPRVCAITSLSLDHTSVLGETIQSIAAEKAGIIKHGVPVVTAPQVPKAMEVIESVSREKGAELVKVGEDLTWRKGDSTSDGQHVEVRGRLSRYDLWTPLLGEHQLENVAVAVGALEVLIEQGMEISRRAIDQGFTRVQWPCRMEVLSRSPLLVCDGAHNPYSVSRLMDSLPRYFHYDRLALIFGVSQDKNLEGIVEELGSFLGSEQRKPLVIATRSRHPRASAAETLARAFRIHDIDAVEVGNVGKALEVAVETTREPDPDDAETLILVTGSLFVAAEAREAVHGIEPELYPELPDTAGTLTSPQPTRY